MKQAQSYLAVLCVFLILAPQTFAQQGTSTKPADATPRLENEGPHWYSPFTQKYNPLISLPINLANSTRLDSLIRGGKLYLTLQDAIDLALENSIDIEVQRYQFPLADQALKSARAGGAATGVSTAVAGGATSAGGAAPGGGVSTASTSTVVAPGTSIPNLDPVLTGNVNWGHTTTPNANSVTTGIIAPVNVNKLANFSVSQGFLSGTNASLSLNNTTTTSSAYTNLYNPSTTSNLDLQITQHLLQGFGFAINNRNIRVAKNNLRVADYTFQEQVISTVANVITLYWNLVSFIASVDVAQKSLAYSQKLYSDNQTQVEIGTLAPVEVTRARAEVATDMQTLLTAQTNVLQQEVILKNALSRNGLASPALSDATIVPLDRIQIPDTEPVQPIQDLLSEALAKRPDLAQTRIQIDNSKINLTGTRAAMLPTLDAVADLRNGALSGTPNTLTSPLLTTNPGLVNPGNLSYATCYANPGLCKGSSADPFFVGGYGSVLGQIFDRNFPNYSIGVQLNIPLRNRQAQASMATAQLQLRQSELGLQKSINQIRVDINNALIAVTQARARYDSAVLSQTLEEQLLDAENKKFQLGTSTPFQIILVQRDLATAELSKVQALVAYGDAKVQLDQALGTTLEDNHVEIDEAKSGRVSRPASPIPDQGNGAGNGNGNNGNTNGNSANFGR